MTSLLKCLYSLIHHASAFAGACVNHCIALVGVSRSRVYDFWRGRPRRAHALPVIAPIIIVAAVQESTLAPVVNYPCGIAHIDVSPRFCTHSTHPLNGAVVIDVALAVGEAGAPVWIIWRRRRRWWRWWARRRRRGPFRAALIGHTIYRYKTIGHIKNAWITHVFSIVVLIAVLVIFILPMRTAR